MRGRYAKIASIVAALWIPAVASAAELDSSGLLPPPSYDWTITVGAEGRVEPLFQGSKKYVLQPYPLFDFRRYGKPEQFHGPRDGIDFTLFEGRNFQIGPVGQFRSTRRESDDAALRGLGDVPWAVEAGIFVQYWWVPWLRARAEVRQGFHGHHGIVSDVMLDVVAPVGKQLTLSGGPRLTFADSRATRPYFSITAAQSARSGLPAFNARGGVQSVGAGFQARYVWNPQWATHAFVEFERLTNDAANSPLVVQRGSKNQLTIGFGVTRSFDIKQFW
jgi:MipA family protein